MTLPASTYASILAILVFTALLVWAAIGDVRTYKITNKLNMVIAAGFLLLAIPMGMQWPDIFGHLKVGILTAIVTITMFYFGLFGGGDAKLTGAIALWLGPTALLPFLIYSVLAGGLLSIFILCLRKFESYRTKLPGKPKAPKWARRLLNKKYGAPYAVALGIGGLMAIPAAVWFPSTLFS
jgi:prepilin peptidase CpaA